MADWTRYRITPIDVAGRFQEGYKTGKLKRAGEMAAGGDYEGAASTAMPYDMDAAKGYFAVRDYQQQRAERAEDKAFNRTIGAAIGSGDRTQMESARQQAFSTGRLEQGAQLTNMFKQMDEAQLERTRQTYGQMYADMDTLDALSGADRQAAYDEIKRRYADLGLNVSQLPPSWGPNVSRAYRAQMLGPVKALELELDERRVAAQELNAQSSAQRADSSEKMALAAIMRAERAGELSAGGMNSQQFSRANTLRDEFTQQTSNFRTVESLASRSRNYVQSGQVSPMQDIGLVYALAKVYDPTSVVREAEFATVASAGGFGARFQNLVSQAQGKGFDPKTRAELLNAIERAATPLRDERNRVSQEYARRASALGIDPQFVVDDRALAPAPNDVPDFIRDARGNIISNPAKPR